MNKVIVLVLILVISICSGCKTSKEDEMINYETGVFYEKNWDDQTGTYQGDAIPNKETAIAVANQIFLNMEKSKTSQEYTPQSVFYDQQDEVWIVSFWNGADTMTVGGDCSIAIQKKDGKILRIWFGE